MNKTLTATYGSEDTIKNVVEELIDAVGIPQEKVFVDKPNNQVKVITPVATEGEIKKVLQAHNPKNIVEREWKES